MNLPLVILIVCLVAVIAFLSYQSHTCSKSNDITLTEYGKRPTHSKFPRVVVTIDGCKGDLDATIKSVLSQSVRVSEIATGIHDDDKKETCKISDMCKSVLNRYKDPYQKGTVTSTFERELEADTIVVFVKRGYTFSAPDELEKLLDKWTPEAPIQNKNVSVMNGNQCTF